MKIITTKIDPHITYGIYKSTFGWLVVGHAEKGICRIAFIEKKTNTDAEMAIREIWPNANLIRNDAYLKSYAEDIFKLKKIKTPFLVKGSKFQIKVWEALLSIPIGKTLSYSDVAKQIGSPAAVRAVGTACGKNPIGYLIPCHRILTSNGKLGGYHWGKDRKEALLAWESKI